MEQETKELEELDCSKIDKFSLEGKTVISKVVRVVDGDTIKTVFKFHDKYYKWTCRLYDINTPETRTRDLQEKKFGLYVKDYVTKIISDKIVKLKCYKFDNFGRLLVDVITEDINLNLQLVEKNYACKFKDRKSHEWDCNVFNVP